MISFVYWGFVDGGIKNGDIDMDLTSKQSSVPDDELQIIEGASTRAPIPTFAPLPEDHSGGEASESDEATDDENEVKCKKEKGLSELEISKEVNKLVTQEAAVCVSRIERLRFRPINKSRMSIPLCRLVGLQVVRPAMKSDITLLQDHFRDVGYVEGQGVFYVAVDNDERIPKTLDVTPEIIAGWSPNWVIKNEEFEHFLQADPDLRKFSGKMFHVWDGNHRLQSWYPFINSEHPNELAWHFSVDCIMLELKGDVVAALTALHEINW